MHFDKQQLEVFDTHFLLAGPSELQPWVAFYELTHQLMLSPSVDELYRQVVDAGIHQLGFDRMAVLLFDHQQQQIQGTWGTDQQGQLCAEHHFCCDLEQGGLQQTLNELNQHNDVVVWQGADILHDGQVVGQGWSAAAALWHDEHLVGWICCDNLINHGEFSQQQHLLLHLLANQTGELLRYKKAELERQQLSENLSHIVSERTAQLVAAQQQIAHSNQLLEEKIIARTEALAQKNNDLQQTLATLERTQQQLRQTRKLITLNHLLSTLSNQLQQPLSQAIEDAQQIRDDLASIKHHSQQAAVSRNHIQQNLQQALDYNHEISHALKRVDRRIGLFKRLAITPDCANSCQQVNAQIWLNYLVDQVKELHPERFEQHPQLQLSCYCEPPQLTLALRSQPLLQIGEILLVNALKHGGQNTHTIIEVSLKQHKQHFTLSIEDNGNGDPNQLTTLLQDNDPTRTPQNHGLGLHIVSNLLNTVVDGKLHLTRSVLGGLAAHVEFHPCHPN